MISDEFIYFPVAPWLEQWYGEFVYFCVYKWRHLREYCWGIDLNILEFRIMIAFLFIDGYSIIMWLLNKLPCLFSNELIDLMCLFEDQLFQNVRFVSFYTFSGFFGPVSKLIEYLWFWTKEIFYRPYIIFIIY